MEPVVVASPEEASPRPKPRRALRLFGVFAFVAALVLLATHAALDSAFRESVHQRFGQSADDLYTRMTSEFFLNPWFYGVFGLILLLEHLIPAKEGQKSWSLGLRHDLLWIPLKMVFHASLLPLYLVLLQFLYDRYLGFFTIQGISDWPWLGRVLLGLLVGDFLFWVTHVVRHHVPSLWYFHAVHHSQKELNFFTEYRVHPVDDLFVFTIGVIPFFMVQESIITVVAIVWIRHWHTRLYHSNIRSNFGILRYLLVTPQSHRVHHSIEPRHFDKNFGLTFSIWDYLFGTQYRRYDEYPDTGIDDDSFPYEQGEVRLSMLGTLTSQFLYPFRALFR